MERSLVRCFDRSLSLSLFASLCSANNLDLLVPAGCTKCGKKALGRCGKIWSAKKMRADSSLYFKAIVRADFFPFILRLQIGTVFPFVLHLPVGSAPLSLCVCLQGTSSRSPPPSCSTCLSRLPSSGTSAVQVRSRFRYMDSCILFLIF